MNEKRYISSMKGYLLLPPSPIREYRGVDRNPFQPAVLPDEMDEQSSVSEGDSRVWVLYPPGWRRDAYRLYEDNLVQGSDENLLDLLSNTEAVRDIKRIIEPHVGFHEIVACELWNLESEPPPPGVDEPRFLGFDVAYPGGDFYSAILNGLFINPDSGLIRDYKSSLNKFGLFQEAHLIPDYVRQFRQAVLSEANSEFSIYRLRLEE